VRLPSLVVVFEAVIEVLSFIVLVLVLQVDHSADGGVAAGEDVQVAPVPERLVCAVEPCLPLV
jgi:hypothetical protein